VHLEVEIADDRPIMAAVCGDGKKVLISEINYGPVVAISSHWPIIAACRKNGRIHRLNLEYVAVGMPIEMREDSTRLLKVWKYSPWSRRRRALASTERSTKMALIVANPLSAGWVGDARPDAPLLLRRHNALDPPSGMGLADFFRILAGEKASGIGKSCGKSPAGHHFLPQSASRISAGQAGVG
jgi:hypothetical protein